MSKYFLKDFSGENVKEAIVSKFFGIQQYPDNRYDITDYSESGIYDRIDDYTQEQWLEFVQSRKTEVRDMVLEVFHDGVELLFAYYEKHGWCGDAFILFKENGVLYEVHAKHCSCNGLEEQWDPEETTIEAIEHFLTKGALGREGGVELGEEEPFWHCFDDEEQEELLQAKLKNENHFAEELTEFIAEYKANNPVH